MITVEQLRVMLLSYPDDAVVVMASDSEGNSYSPLTGSERGLYAADNTWSGSVYDPKETDPPPPSKAVPCVVLCPVN